MSGARSEKSIQAAYERLEKSGLFDTSDEEVELAPSEALNQEPARGKGDSQRMVTECADRILQFYGLCVREMGLRRSEVVAAIELATVVAYNDPNSGLTPEQIEKAREFGYRMYNAKK